MQETKAKDEQFPHDRLQALGYEVAHHGTNQWNGVAILSRVGLDDVQVGFDGDPGWGEPPAAEARSIGATCNGIRLWSVYVPNGRALDDPHMVYKLDWLARLREQASAWAADGTPVALCGDWNIAPQDDDVWSMEYYLDKSHVSPGERAAFNAFLEAGLRRRRAPAHPRPGRLHLLGLPAARLPEAARHAHRLRARLTVVRGARRGCGDRPRGAQGRRRQRPRAGRRAARRTDRMPSRTSAHRATSRAARLPDGAVRHRVRIGAGTDVHVVEWPATAAAAGTPAEGVTVVLAHGWTLSHASWLPVVELLRSRYGVRVVAFDQPGHGLSAAESRAPTVHELGEVLHRVLTAVAPSGPLVLAGHSMGGMTIMAWAADHADELADRVRGVVFVATSAKVGEDRVRLPLERAADAGLGPGSRGSRRAGCCRPVPRPGCSTGARRRGRRSCRG